MSNVGMAMAPSRNMSNIRPDLKQAQEVYEKMKTEMPEEQDKTRSMLTGNFDDWLKLLVATVKYQDPTDPMDTSEMAAQMTSFGQLDAMIRMENELKKSSALQADSQLLEASSQIDRMMEFSGNKFSFTKDQTSEINFIPPAGSKSCSLIISDEQNRVVASQTIETKPEEKNSFKWDGKLRDGTKAEYGRYQIKVVPFDENKKILVNPKTKRDYEVATSIKDIAKSGIREKGMPMIVLGDEGGASYPLGSMIAIHANQQKSPTLPTAENNNSSDRSESESQSATTQESASENTATAQPQVDNAQVTQAPTQQNVIENVPVDQILNNLAS